MTTQLTQFTKETVATPLGPPILPIVNELLDVRGTLAVEDDQKVVYVSCLISPQPVSLVLTLPLSSTGNRQQVILITARLVVFRFAIPVQSPYIDIRSELNRLVLVKV